MWKIKFPGKLPSANRNFSKYDFFKRKKLNDRNTLSIRNLFSQDKPQLSTPATIYLTRISPRRIDSDNLQYAFKGIRDTITQLIFPEKRRGFGDESSDLTFIYTQLKGNPKEYAIQIEIKETHENQSCAQ